MIVNSLMEMSDAVVAAWLPGTSGGALLSIAVVNAVGDLNTGKHWEAEIGMYDVGGLL